MFHLKKKEESQETTQVHDNQNTDFAKQIQLLQTKVETQEAKLAAQAELRQVTDGKISRLQEQIGEIKELYQVLSVEKQDLVKQIEITKKLIETAKPLELFKEVSKIQNKQTILEGKYDLAIRKQNAFQSSFDEFSQKLRAFKGADQLIKIQEETKKDLFEVKKMNSKIVAHAEKIENHYIEIKSKVEHVDTQINQMTNLHAELSKLKEDMNKLLNDPEFDKKTYESLKQAHDTLTDLVAQTFSKLKEKQKQIKEDLEKHKDHHQNTINSLKQTTDYHITRFSDSFEKIHTQLSRTDLESIDKLKKWVVYLIKTDPKHAHLLKK
ncbi:MAG: hypothetical protein ACMXYF_03305 [Candidatus Woesearchaeota archaeon]